MMAISMKPMLRGFAATSIVVLTEAGGAQGTAYHEPALLAFMAALVSAADDTPALKPADDQVEKERATQALELCRKGAKEYRLYLTTRSAPNWS